MGERFIDEGHWIYEFIKQPIDVQCSQCGDRAQLLPWNVEDVELHSPRRLSCTSCGHTRDHDGSVLAFYVEGRDPCFGYLLWYRFETSKGVVWAYHRDHLDQLRSFLSADLRERNQNPVWRNRSYFSRLPRWIKSAKNRNLVLRAIDRMAESETI